MKKFLCFLSTAFILLGASVGAESYDVSAIVPFDPPTAAATISGPSSQAISTASTLVSGTCQYSAQTNIVTVIRNQLIAGSVVCPPSGVYSLTISLSEGLNILVVRTSNLNGVYGPDSNSAEILYTIPSLPVNLPINADEALDAPSSLSLQTSSTFQTITENSRKVTISFEVSGGDTPYTIEINWGDGSVETKTVNEPGIYTFVYEYAESGVYVAKATVTDVKGVSRQISFTVVGTGPKSLAETGQVKPETPSSVRRVGSPVWTYVVVGIPLLLIGYSIGALSRSRLGSKAKKKKRKS